jgi:hypothetical protein
MAISTTKVSPRTEMRLRDFVFGFDVRIAEPRQTVATVDPLYELRLQIGRRM